MTEELAKAGLYLDEFNKLRIIDPAISSQTSDLIETSKSFQNNVSGLEETIDSFLTLVEDFGKTVDKEKMMAIGIRNALKSVEKDREQQFQKLQGLILEKTIELERLQLEYHSLQLVEVEQQEITEYLSKMR